MRRLLMCGLAAGCMTTSMAHGAEITQRTTYFMVKGSTYTDLEKELGSKGPLMSSGMRHSGRTDVAFSRDLEFAPGKDGCRLKRTNLQLTLMTTLPRWNPPRDADAQTRTKWKILQREIAEHEAKHSAIARTWLDRMNRELMALPAEPTCMQMDVAASRRSRALVVEQDNAQRDFDREEAQAIDSRLGAKLAAATTHAVR